MARACLAVGTRALLPLSACLLLLSGLRLYGSMQLERSHRALSIAERIAGDGPLLLLAFQLADCPDHTALLGGWEDLQRTGQVRVVGAVVDAHSDTLRAERTLRPLGLEFPLRFDLAAPLRTLLLRLGYGRTPVGLLFDAQGRLRLVVSEPQSARSTQAPQRVVEEYARTFLQSSAQEAAR